MVFHSLKVNRMTDPMGIDRDRLSFSFLWEGEGGPCVCTVWEGDRIATQEKIGLDRSHCFTLAWKPEPGRRYRWQISSWESVSPEAYFETAISFSAPWITPERPVSHPTFVRRFQARQGDARLYITGLGLYEAYLNGHRVGEDLLTPGFTKYTSYVRYQTYDVTALLREDNELQVTLGDGWYKGRFGLKGRTDIYGNRYLLAAELRQNGRTLWQTDRQFEVWSSGFLSSGIYDGECFDANIVPERLCGVELTQAGYPIVPQSGPPVRVMGERKPILIRTPKGEQVLDFGQNMAGVTKLRLRGEAGTQLRLIHAERLREDGHADLSNIDVYFRPTDKDDLFQTDVVTLSGRDDEFMPRFNYKGFRYVEVVADRPVELSAENLTAYAMHSDVTPVGHIETSNDLVDKLWDATNKAYLSNLMGYPTDCPQREKNGWTGDGHLAIETALYNYDGITVYEKWLADHRDEQQPNGVLPDIIPTGGWGYGTANGLDWTSTIAIIPWNLYLFYGDTKPLEDCYENIKRYVDYVDRRSPGHLSSWGRGDWVPVRSQSSLELTSSVYFYVDATILARAAALFGREADRKHYEALAGKIRGAINDKYLDRATGIYASGTQTELSVPLMWGVVPEEMVAKVAGNLARKVAEAGFHLDVGVLGAKAILNALSENGHAETAYKVAVQDTYPSWGWWIVNGATTLLENWNLEATRDISDNHMMFGEIGGWFFKGLGGIKPDPEAPGFKHILLRPNFVGPEEFEVSHDAPCGRIVSAWTRRGNTVTYRVRIPANSTATLYLPANVDGGKVHQLGAGSHTLTLRVAK